MICFGRENKALMYPENGNIGALLYGKRKLILILPDEGVSDTKNEGLGADPENGTMEIRIVSGILLGSHCVFH